MLFIKGFWRMIKKNNIITVLLCCGMLLPQTIICSDDTIGLNTYFKTLINNIQQSEWTNNFSNVVGENQKVALFALLVIVLGLAVYKKLYPKTEKVKKKKTNQHSVTQNINQITSKPTDISTPSETFDSIIEEALSSSGIEFHPEDSIKAAEKTENPEIRALIASISDVEELSVDEKTYPIELYNAYDSRIAYTISRYPTDTAPVQYLAPNASVQFSATVLENNLIIKDSKGNSVEGFAVRSSGHGSGYGVRPFTNFNAGHDKLFLAWKDTIRYALTENAAQSPSFQIKLQPTDTSLLQLSPTTPFEAQLQITYE